MPTKRDYYDILGISRSASAEEIKRAYRNLARKYHPDVNKQAGAEEKFKEINEAYDVLSEDSKRRAYDRFGHEAVNGAAAGPGGYGAGFGGLDDIFNMFVNFGPRGAAPTATAERGDDLRYDLEITLEEAALGIEKTVQFNRIETCDLCHGSGARPGTQVDMCPTCKGVGVVRHTQNTLLGTFQTSTTCPRCHGEGRAVSNPCPQCNGGGRLRKTRERTIRIPAGVDTGSRIRVAAEGDSGLRGGEPGDLYVVIYVKPHDLFERRGNDLYCEMPVGFVTASLGGQITVPTIYGEEKLAIPEGTQSGASFRLKDKGMAKYPPPGRGDLYVIVKVAVPTKLTADQRHLLRQLAESLGEEVHDHGDDKGFLGRLFRGDK